MFLHNEEPKYYGSKVPVELLNPAHRSTQRKIVMYHNFFRSRVHPPAADMLAMVRFSFVPFFFSSIFIWFNIDTADLWPQFNGDALEPIWN